MFRVDEISFDLFMFVAIEVLLPIFLRRITSFTSFRLSGNKFRVVDQRPLNIRLFLSGCVTFFLFPFRLIEETLSRPQ